MCDLAKDIHDAEVLVGPKRIHDQQGMLEGLDLAIEVLQHIKQNVEKGNSGPLGASYTQFRDVRPQYAVSALGEHRGYKQFGPLVTQITVLDYADANKRLDKS